MGMDGYKFWNCWYCGAPRPLNKQGQWGIACSGCKGSLTKRLRSGDYGHTYAKETRELLKQTRYDPESRKWVGNLTRHWYEYNWWTKRDKHGKPPLDYKYILETIE